MNEMISFDSSEFNNWSDKPNASHQLPELIRHLIMNTCPRLFSIHMPSGSSVRRPGWDGLLTVESGNPWVPNGNSAWEFSSAKDTTRKATEDYTKRTVDPLGEDIVNTTFVFVTSRTWTGKRAWVRKYNAEGSWAGVRAFDADDLVVWLEQAPDVALWFAHLIGKIHDGQGFPPMSMPDLEGLHRDTRHEIVQRIDDAAANIIETVQASIVTIVTPPESTGLETISDPVFRELETKIDFARDLINDGMVRTARMQLERIRKEKGSIPEELEFRIVTNQGACALADGDMESACSFLEKAHDLQPDNPTSIANAAVAAQLRGNPKYAMELANKARGLDPRASLATAVLMEALWTTGENEQFENLITAEEWISQDRQCGLALASIRMQQSRPEEVVDLCRSLVRRDPEDASAHLVLSQCLLDYSRQDRLPVGYSGEKPKLLHEIEVEATCAIELLQPTELNSRYQAALVARASANARRGKTEAAMQDLDMVLGVEPTHPDAMYYKGLLLLMEARPAEARAVLESIQDQGRCADAVFPLAEACRATGDAAGAVKLLRGTLTFDYPCWEDLQRTEVLIKAEIEAGEEDSVGSDLEAALERHANDPFLLTLAAMHKRLLGDLEGAENWYIKAIEYAGEPHRRVILEQLGTLYESLKRFAEAANRLSEAVDGNASHPAANSLFRCLVNSKRLRKALDWARSIRESQSQPPRVVLEMEAKILERAGDVCASAALLESLCRRNDATPVDRVNLAAAQFRYGNRVASRKTIVEIKSSDLCYAPLSILELAQLKLLLGIDGSLDDAYLARRCGNNDPKIHMGYFGLFQGCNKERMEPKIIGPGCAVLLRNDSTECWWYIVDDREEVRDHHDLRSDQDLAQQLLGRSVGETVVLREDLEDLAYEIVDVQSKFLRAFRETCEEFSTRFPGNRALSRVEIQDDDFTKIFQSIDQRDRISRTVEQKYQEGELTMAKLSSVLRRSVLEIWWVWTKSDTARIRVGTGTEDENNKADKLLRGANCIVLDLLALLTVHELRLAGYLRKRFSKVAVPQPVIDEIHKAVFTMKIGESGSSYMGKNRDGQYTWTDVSENDWEQWQEHLLSVMELADSFERIASYRVLEVDEIENLVAVLSESGVGVIYAGNEESTIVPILISDDLVQSNVARSLATDAVNTQALLRELLRSDVITSEQYSSYIERLASLNYWFMNVHPEDIVRRLKANGYATTEGTRAMLRTIEGPDCTEDFAVSVGVEVITSLVGKAQPGQTELILELVLAALRRGRELSLVLPKFRKKLASRLNHDPFMRDLLLQTVDFHMQF